VASFTAGGGLGEEPPVTFELSVWDPRVEYGEDKPPVVAVKINGKSYAVSERDAVVIGAMVTAYGAACQAARRG
jgi:hypothetical protein